MTEQILAFVFLAVGSALIVYATMGRLLRFHRPFKWESGGTLSFTAELCCGVFVLSMGLTIIHSPGWIIPALAAWIGGFIGQRRASRRLIAEESQLRATNSAQYPYIFDTPPPTNIDATRDEEFDLYDAGAGNYLGKASKQDIKFLMSRLEDVPDQGPNDLFLIQEDLVMFPDGSLSQEFIALLNSAFEQRDYLVLRWIPISHHLPRPVRSS